MRVIATVMMLLILTSCSQTPKSIESSPSIVPSATSGTTPGLPVRLGDNAHYQGGNNHKHRVVVFIHGVYGSAGTTWECPGGKTSWPELMAADDTFKNSDIYVADYPSPKTGNMMSIDDEVSNIMNRAKNDGVFDHKEVVFLVHSLGGLVTQRLLLTHREIAAKTQFIYFFSTPEEGAQIAQIGHLFNNDPLLKQMYQGEENSTLEGIERDWSNANFDIARYCAYERQATKGVVVVGRLSSTRLCNRDPVAIYADHSGIVEPCDANNASYIAFRSAYKDNPVREVKVVQRDWTSPQSVDCERTNANTAIVASVALNPAYRETVEGPVAVRLDGPNNIKDSHIKLVSQTGNTAVIDYGFNGLDKQMLNCPGGGHATVVATFNIKQQVPIE
jgi:hypothetical protein